MWWAPMACLDEPGKASGPFSSDLRNSAKSFPPGRPFHACRSGSCVTFCGSQLLSVEVCLTVPSRPTESRERGSHHQLRA